MDKDTVSVQAFYMFSHEMTNFHWREYQFDLEKSGKTTELEISRVRGENWTLNGNSSKPMAEHYHTHPAYRDYPVVNITHEAAQLYCAWLTDKLNTLPKPLGVKVLVRLPFHSELIRAGVGDQLGAWYPWKHEYMQNTKGDYLCNFRAIPNSALSRDENGQIVKKGFVYDIHEAADLTAPVNSYWPSALGFYNLSGNVAEMIMEPGLAVGGSFTDLGYDVRLQSMQRYEDASCNVGFRVALSVE
jgi:formylglycine-generating enzyme required for sulfatase activity